MLYTQREYAEMHFIYGFCDGNARGAAREYRNRYPNREYYPDYRVFIRVHNAYVAGRLPGESVREGRPRNNVEEMVLNEIEANSSTSVRRISRVTGVPKSTVHRTLKIQLLHPYHVQRVQELLPEDYPRRMQFCREILTKCRHDPNFFNSILWTDECGFKRNGIFNIHNLHFWEGENPHAIRNDRFQRHFSVNLWAGIINAQLIGPFELPARLNGEEYLRFLENELPVLLEDVLLGVRQQMWLQLDGAPPHYARQVQHYLNQTYAGRWIGRGGPILWPPRSPDLNPLDFFLWGNFKEQVYLTESPDEQTLRQKILRVAEQIRRNEQALRRIKRNFFRRCRLCIRAGGGYFEHLLK